MSEEGNENAFEVSQVINTDGTMTGDDWYTKLAPETVEKIGDNKHLAKMTSVDQLATEVVELSRFKGKTPIPAPDAPDEEWDNVFKAAGVPGDNEQYGFSLDELQNETVKQLAEKSGFVDRMERIMKAAGVPKRLAVKIANASLQESMAGYDAYQQDVTAGRQALVEKWGSEAEVEKRAKAGAEALTRIYGADTEARDALMAQLDNAGLKDHPLVTDLLDRLAQKVSPGKIVLGGSRPGATQKASPIETLLPNTAKAIRSRTG